MHCGHCSVDILETGDFGLDGGAMFGVVPQNLWAKVYHKPDEQNRIPMKARALLIRMMAHGVERKILVDTGNGSKFSEKLAAIYNIDHSQSSLLRSLANFGLQPADITDVILTHLHFDHAGGATIVENNEAVPAFPNAQYYVQQEHLAWAIMPSDKDRASFMPHDFEPLRHAGCLNVLEGAGELFPGLSVTPLYGHTRAMQMVQLKTETHKILFAADLFPTSAHVPVPYVMAYDNNPLVTIDEKKRLLPELYEDRWTVIFQHDAFVQASTIQSTGKSFSRGDVVEITPLQEG